MSDAAPGGGPQRLVDALNSAAAGRDWHRADRRTAVGAICLVVLSTRPSARARAAELDAREAMVAAIEGYAAQAGVALEGRSAIDARVRAPMPPLPRHAFVPAKEAAYAYEDRPLPIGYGQTISQ